MRHIFCILALTLAATLSQPAQAMQFNTRAAATFTTNTTQIATDTSIVLSSGKGALVPPTPCYLYWFNSTDFSFPMDDPLGEVVQVTKVSTDTITVVRGMLNTTANAHNIGGKTYTMCPQTPGQSRDPQVLASVNSAHTTVGDAGSQSNDFGTNGVLADIIMPHTSGNVASATLGGGVTSFLAPLEVVANVQSSAAGIGCTSGGTDDTLFTYSLPANTLKNVNDWVVIECWGKSAANTHNVTAKTWFGGTAIATTGVVSTTSAFPIYMRCTVVKTAANTQLVTNDQITFGAGTSNIAPVVPTAAAITDTSAIIIKFTALCTTANEGLGMVMKVTYGGAGAGL